MSVVFTAAGLDTLEANRASQVQVTIGTTVLETGIIPNDATLFTSNPYSNSKVDSNTVEVHVHRLRRELGSTLIQTVRGVGYVLMRPPGMP